LRSASAE